MPEVYQRDSPNARLLKGGAAAGEMSWRSYIQRAAASVGTHVAMLFVIVFLLERIPPRAQAGIPKATPTHITWLQAGGGGGRDANPKPPRKTAMVRSGSRVPVHSPRIAEPPRPLPPISVPAVTTVTDLPGTISVVPDAASLGAGTGGGGGAGRGAGPGSGPGLGPGQNGGSGNGEYRDGNGVTPPMVIKEIKPNYTGEAMRARIQGAVMMEAVVMPDGSVGRIHITRSLDSAFGLDQEALRTVKQWRFKPGTRLGQAVPVLVVIELAFTLR